MKDLRILLAILVAIFILWAVLGGAKDMESVQNPFIKPAQPLDTGETYGPTEGAVTQTSTLPSGWTRAQANFFSVGLPDGWIVREVPSNSSKLLRGEIRSSTITISYEYAAFVQPAVFEGDPRHTMTTEKIGRRSAILFRPTRNDLGLTGAYFKRPLDKNNFSLSADTDTDAEEDLVFAILRTITFIE